MISTFTNYFFHTPAVAEREDAEFFPGTIIDDAAAEDTGKKKERQTPTFVHRLSRAFYPGLSDTRSDKPPTWTASDFLTVGKLGKGRFGMVHHAREATSRYEVALKVISKEQMHEFELENNLKREIEIQGHLSHPGIIKLYGYFKDKKNIYLILEYASGGCLYEYMTNKCGGSFSEEKAAKYFVDIVHALRYCHSKSVIHRDLKPENLVLDSKGNVKLTDFGWSVHMVRSDRRMTRCGTLDFLSPEQVEGEEYDYGVDIWALGAILYEMLYGTAPFCVEDNDPKTARILTKMSIVTKPVAFPEDRLISREAKDLILALLRKEQQQRPTLSEALCHPWVMANTTYR